MTTAMRDRPTIIDRRPAAPARRLVPVLALVLLAGCAARQTDIARQAAVAESLAASIVRVQYTLRYDKGEAPETGQSALEEERPLESAGFLVSPTEVLTDDRRIHPRFVERVAVCLGDDVVPASLAGWGKRHNAVLVRLERPLKGGKPIEFDAAKEPPYLEIRYYERGGEWETLVSGFAPALVVRDGQVGQAAGLGGLHMPVGGASLVTDAQGAPVGLVMQPDLPADDSWKGPPLAWPLYTDQERTEMLETVHQRCDAALVRVTIHLRSPKRETGSRYRGRDDTDSATEIHATGVVLEGGRVLVLANLRPVVTARLERMTVRTEAGETCGAAFAGSLTDYGCLVATLDSPPAAAMALSDVPIQQWRNALLPSVEVRLHGEDRTVYFEHERFWRLEVGWRGQLELRTVGRDRQGFLFDPDGRLVALPLARRQKVATDRQWSSDRPALVPVARLGPILGDLAKHADPGNVPLTEDTEQRLAWLGVILQPLNRDLARANNVAQWTSDGESGAIVSYVYPGSPAAAAGVVPGIILLRLRAEGRADPIEVRLEDHYDRGPFPWERMDEVPETYYDRIPPPWPPAENGFTRALTDLGFGRRFEADFFIDGQVVSKALEVTPSPPHYDSAPRYKAEALGLTVRDLTYEARRYFQKAPDEPGVIVSKIEPGSKASVAGLKPYEIVTHVNGRPVMTVKDFAEAVGAAGELRLSVKRMMQGRVVKMSLDDQPPPEP